MSIEFWEKEIKPPQEHKPLNLVKPIEVTLTGKWYIEIFCPCCGRSGFREDGFALQETGLCSICTVELN